VARYETLNMEYDHLCKRLREILMEVSIEREKGSKHYKDFKKGVIVYSKFEK
jgi:hypothetical protein